MELNEYDFGFENIKPMFRKLCKWFGNNIRLI